MSQTLTVTPGCKLHMLYNPPPPHPTHAHDIFLGSEGSSGPARCHVTFPLDQSSVNSRDVTGSVWICLQTVSLHTVCLQKAEYIQVFVLRGCKLMKLNEFDDLVCGKLSLRLTAVGDYYVPPDYILNLYPCSYLL